MDSTEKKDLDGWEAAPDALYADADRRPRQSAKIETAEVARLCADSGLELEDVPAAARHGLWYAQVDGQRRHVLTHGVRATYVHVDLNAGRHVRYLRAGWTWDVCVYTADGFRWVAEGGEEHREHLDLVDSKLESSAEVEARRERREADLRALAAREAAGANSSDEKDSGGEE